MCKNTSRKTVVSGVLIIALSIVMLIGVTYAVFTDTSSTNVNTIQAGTLKVDIVDSADASLEGETISFVGGSDLLWEPDGEYTLNTFYVKNKGDIKLKFKIQVNGLNGADGLDRYIDWSAKVNNVDVTVEELNSYEATLDPGAKIPVVLTGKMQHGTPIEMMGESASSISITVLATQANDNAEYPELP